MAFFGGEDDPSPPPRPPQRGLAVRASTPDVHRDESVEPDQFPMPEDVEEDRLPPEFTAQDVAGESVAHIVGTCEFMCPPMLLDTGRSMAFEGGPTGELDTELATKAWTRPDAGKEFVPSQLRTPRTLLRTCKHLIFNCLPRIGEPTRGGSTVQFRDVWMYLKDRLWSIQQDFYVQGIVSSWSIQCLEVRARFHIMSGHVMCGHDAQMGYDAKANRDIVKDCVGDQLWKCYLSFRMKYKTVVQEGGALRNAPEFVAYRLLLNELRHHDDHKKWRESSGFTEPWRRRPYGGLRRSSDHAVLQIANLMPEVLDTPEVKFALRVLRAYVSDNWVEFFRLFKQAPYLQACLMSTVLPFARIAFLSGIWRALGGVAPGIDYLGRILMFDDGEQSAELHEFLKRNGFPLRDPDQVGSELFSSRTHDCPKEPDFEPGGEAGSRIRFPCKSIEMLRLRRSHAAVCWGLGEVWSLPEVAGMALKERPPRVPRAPRAPRARAPRVPGRKSERAAAGTPAAKRLAVAREPPAQSPFGEVTPPPPFSNPFATPAAAPQPSRFVPPPVAPPAPSPEPPLPPTPDAAPAPAPVPVPPPPSPVPEPAPAVPTVSAAAAAAVAEAEAAARRAVLAAEGEQRRGATAAWVDALAEITAAAERAERVKAFYRDPARLAAALAVAGGDLRSSLRRQEVPQRRETRPCFEPTDPTAGTAELAELQGCDDLALRIAAKRLGVAGRRQLRVLCATPAVPDPATSGLLWSLACDELWRLLGGDEGETRTARCFRAGGPQGRRVGLVGRSVDVCLWRVTAPPPRDSPAGLCDVVVAPNASSAAAYLTACEAAAAAAGACSPGGAVVVDVVGAGGGRWRVLHLRASEAELLPEAIKKTTERRRGVAGAPLQALLADGAAATHQAVVEEGTRGFEEDEEEEDGDGGDADDAVRAAVDQHNATVDAMVEEVRRMGGQVGPAPPAWQWYGGTDVDDAWDGFGEDGDAFAAPEQTCLADVAASIRVTLSNAPPPDTPGYARHRAGTRAAAVAEMRAAVTRLPPPFAAAVCAAVSAAAAAPPAESEGEARRRALRLWSGIRAALLTARRPELHVRGTSTTMDYIRAAVACVAAERSLPRPIPAALLRVVCADAPPPSPPPEHPLSTPLRLLPAASRSPGFAAAASRSPEPAPTAASTPMEPAPPTPPPAPPPPPFRSEFVDAAKGLLARVEELAAERAAAATEAKAKAAAVRDAQATRKRAAASPTFDYGGDALEWRRELAEQLGERALAVLREAEARRRPPRRRLLVS